jgi:hypothetical protein
MKKYKFLFKPIFFIFNLLFATWLVFRIEKIQPSDFGRYKGIFGPAAAIDMKDNPAKSRLLKIMKDFREGKMSEQKAEREIEKVIRKNP